MRTRLLVSWLVALGVLAVWVYSIGQRLPYMDQVPVFDADATTSEAHMWARMWWDEGPLKMWFSTPTAPRSIETPTMASRVLYESWPPGAFVPIYLLAKFLGLEPSIPMVNWINATLHGLIALAAAFAVFNVALLNRLGHWSSGLLAVGIAFPILLSRGPLYVFSQIYDVVIAVLIYTIVFILLEVMYYRAQSPRDRRVIGAFQLITIFLAFFVDWLSYTLFAFWLAGRLIAGQLGVAERLTLRRMFGLALIPVCGFSIYLIWRFFAPGSIAQGNGLRASIQQLGLKILERMNLTETSPVSGFSEVFFGEMHDNYYTDSTFLLIALSALATLALTIISFRRANDASERRSVFVTGLVLVLITVPFYLHMILLYQHTFIHRWAITKAMFAYSMIPFALLPISVFTVIRQLVGQPTIPSRKIGLAAASLLATGIGCYYAVDVTRYATHYLMGRVNRENYLMWDDIGRKTLYKDVVVSPVLVANPISPEIGASYKRVHHADNFADVDKVVKHVCGDFNVVLALPKGSEPGEFASRQPGEVIDTGRIRLLRFSSYRGKALGCPNRLSVN